MAAGLSICIPTYNRDAFLDDCLTRLGALKDPPLPIEIVVSDNGSTDDTQRVIASHCHRNPAIRAHRLPENRGPWANRLNTLYQAKNDLVVFNADDDAILFDPLFAHIDRMVREPDLVAIFADWIAWDDQQQREIHRYFSISEPVGFAPEDPLGLVNFTLRQMIQPEIGIYRREALVRAQSEFSLALPFHIWMYALSRLGRIRFDPLAFYREVRVPREGLTRGHWANMEMQLQFIGDEMRVTLESLLLMALQDAGVSHLPEDQVFSAKQAIDRMLGARIGLEIDRACRSMNWVLAVELRRRQVLWAGPGSRDEIQRDVLNLVVPAALQAVHQTFRSLSNVDGLLLKGFASSEVANVFAQRYPGTPILSGAETGRALIVHRDEASLAQDRNPKGHVIVLERLLRLYRVSQERIDLTRL